LNCHKTPPFGLERKHANKSIDKKLYSISGFQKEAAVPDVNPQKSDEFLVTKEVYLKGLQESKKKTILYAKTMLNSLFLGVKDFYESEKMDRRDGYPLSS